MKPRISPGPVFVFESILSARRWQYYAGRAAFVAIILIGLTLTWWNFTRLTVSFMSVNGVLVQNTTLRQLAQIGENFFYCLAGVQITLILLAAPAATAGSICIDRANGSLLHMMVTELNDSEIVLGKLASRLAPTLAMIAASIPVACLGALLGGIDLAALIGLMLVSVSLAVVACALAMLVSLVATKVHEVLMAVYMIEGLCLYMLPFWGSLRSRWIPAPPDWFQKLNPYVLAFAPYAQPQFVVWEDFAIFAAVSAAISLILIAFTWRYLRVVVTTSPKLRPPRAFFQEPRWLLALRQRYGPTLDGNPVLWREWHRNRPTRLGRIVWSILLFGSGAMILLGTCLFLSGWMRGAQTTNKFLYAGISIQTIFGLLLLSTTAPTTLAEERIRGSLDVLLSTPLSTREIVAGKWWGVFRLTLILAALPTLGIVILAYVLPDIDPRYGALFTTRGGYLPLNPSDRILAPLTSVAQWLSTGAMISSLGILMATWFDRVGRAVTAGVVMYLVLGIGWLLLSETCLFYLFHFNQTTVQILDSICIYGMIFPFETLTRPLGHSRNPIWIGILITAVFKGILAMVFFVITVRIFDRRIGRMSERYQVHQRPPRLFVATAPQSQ